MTRIAAYVVLILFAFIVASTVPAWQVHVRVPSDAPSRLAEYLAKPDARTPSAPVRIIEGREVYFAACASCHGSVNGTSQAGMADVRSPSRYSPLDIQQLITWGHYIGYPEGIANSGQPIELAKNHPAFPASLTDTERWAVAIYVHQAWLHPIGEPTDRLWESARSTQSIPFPGPQNTGSALFSRLCANCHGLMGYGNGPLAHDLVPPPGDFRNLAWQANQSDAHLLSVISYGAFRYDTDSSRESPFGMTPTGMPGWGDNLSDASILRLLEYIRSFSYTIDSFADLETRPSPGYDDEEEFPGASEDIIVPDANQWTWEEIRAVLIDAPYDPPAWLSEQIE